MQKISLLFLSCLKTRNKRRDCQCLKLSFYIHKKAALCVKRYHIKPLLLLRRILLLLSLWNIPSVLRIVITVWDIRVKSCFVCKLLSLYISPSPGRQPAACIPAAVAEKGFPCRGVKGCPAFGQRTVP